jgi:hypothetical protein
LSARHVAAVVAVAVLALTGCGSGSAAQGEPTVAAATPASGSSSSSTATTTSVMPKATTSVMPKAQLPEGATASANGMRGDVASAGKGATITEGSDPKGKIGRPGGHISASASPRAPLPTQPPVTLRVTCSKVDKVLSGLSGQSSPPTAPKLDAALAQVKLLNGAGDAATRNALSAVLKALPAYRDEDPAGVANDGRRAFLDSLASLTDRCRSVGSSALRWVG